MATVTTALNIGDQLPDLRLPTVDGGMLRLRALAGRQVLLFCWASW